MEQKRRNILVFVTDDHAQWALGCYGNREIQSPNLDHLAATGVRMANSFTPIPVCSPARACVLTGLVGKWHVSRVEPKRKKLSPGRSFLPMLTRGTADPREAHNPREAWRGEPEGGGRRVASPW